MDIFRLDMDMFKFFIFTLIFIINNAYADIRGEFAKRPAALPPEPAAVVQYLMEDVGNARAQASTICFRGKTISVNLADLGATPTFFQAIDKALDNAGMGAFTSRDFLDEQPDSIISNGGPVTSRLYYSTDNIQFDNNATSVGFQRVDSTLTACTTNQCLVLSNCGFNYDFGTIKRIGGCLATSSASGNLSGISDKIGAEVVLDTLVSYIPRSNIYFANPAASSSPDYFLAAETSGTKAQIGCSDPGFNVGGSNICGSSSGIANSIYDIDYVPSGERKLQKPARQIYILAFRINKCPTS